MYPTIAPSEVPSFGFELNIGAITHGDFSSFVRASSSCFCDTVSCAVCASAQEQLIARITQISAPRLARIRPTFQECLLSPSICILPSDSGRLPMHRLYRPGTARPIGPWSYGRDDRDATPRTSDGVR